MTEKETQEPFIKLYRRLLKWQWYHDPNATRVFLHCLLKANFQDNQWNNITIKKGQFVTSVKSLVSELGLSTQTVRTQLVRLKSTNEITIKTTSQYSIITINNWDKWQTNQQTNQQTSNKPVTTIKERKERKEIYIGEENKKENILNFPLEEKQKFKKPTLEEIENYCKEKNYDFDCERFYDYYESKGWIVGKSPMKDWKAAARNWRKNQDEYKSKAQKEQKENDYTPKYEDI